MVRPMFTPEELEELSRADAELDDTFVQTIEEFKESGRRDRQAIRERKACEGGDRIRRKQESYDANRPEILKKKRAYYEANREAFAAYGKAYREANRESIKARNRAYYEERRQEILDKKKAYYRENREKILERNKAYQRRKKHETLALSPSPVPSGGPV